MTTKKITILILPDGSSRTRQLKVPKAIFWVGLIIMLAASGGLSWILKDYWVIKKKMPLLAEFEKKNKNQAVQLTALATKVDGMNNKMLKLRNFENRLRVMVNLEPNDDNTQFLGIGGSDPALLNPEYVLKEGHRKLVRVMHNSLDNLDDEVTGRTKDLGELCRFFENQKSLLACTPSVWPTKGWVSSRFGYRISPFTNTKEFHHGLDICTRVGAPIVAPADGVVSNIGKDYGYGNVMTINHKYGIKTRYAHLKKVLVKKGQSVKRGEEIALVGTTGRTTGPHLHYEVKLNGVAVDPLRYILD